MEPPPSLKVKLTVTLALRIFIQALRGGLKFREFLTDRRKLVLFKFSIVLLLLLYQTVLTFANRLLLFISFAYINILPHSK